MTLYEFLPLLQGCLSGILAIVVLWKGGKQAADRLFLAFLLSMTLWGLLIYGMRSSPDLDRALWWERGAVVFIASTSVFFYHFSVRYSSARVSGRYLTLIYLFLLTIIALTPTKLIIEGMTTDSYGNAPEWGVLSPLYVMPFAALVALAIFQLGRARNASTSYEERNRLLYFIIGGSVCLAGGIVDVLPTLDINIYPGSIVGNIMFVILTTVAILRYHLFDIELATHRLAPYLIMIVLVTGFYMGSYVALYEFWGDERAPLWLHLIFALSIAVGVWPLWTRVQEWTNWLFYRERYEHLKALKRLQEESRSISDPAAMRTLFPQIIRQAMRASHLSLLLPSASTGHFEVASSVGSNGDNPGLKLSRSSSIIEWLRTHPGLLRREDMAIVPGLQAQAIREKEAVERLRGELYVPLKSSNRLVGLLVIGPKVNRQPYSWEDEGLLGNIAIQMALNVENIQLYQASLERERQLAALSSLDKTISSSLDIQSTYDVFARRLKEIIPVDWASIVLIEEEYLRFFALSTAIDSGWGKPGTTMPFSGTATEWLVLNKKSLVESNLRQQSRFSTAEAHVKNGLKSIVYLPLFSQGEVMGSFIVGSAAADVYGDKEVAFLEQVAGQLSLTMDNARLYARERGERSRLEILNEQRDEFFMAISHELKTPLTAIKSSSELLGEELSTKGPPPLKRLSDNIKRGADRLEVMLNDLLDMAKARAVPLELNFQRLDVSRAIRDGVELCSSPIRQKRQTLTVEVPDGEIIIMGDPERFGFVITNLLTNANKYTAEDGQIKIKAWTEDSKVLMSVEDNGAGIPEEEQELIFDPFYRGKFSGERVKGVGVGLATVKQVVRLHGGKIQVKSEVGKGSTFTVSLPLP